MANPASGEFLYTFPAPPSGLQAQQYHRQFPAQPRQPLPSPTGLLPYRVALEQVLGAGRVAAIRRSGQMTFHTVGDTGGINYPFDQHEVALAMSADLASGQPSAFFYHLGDVVYYNGERTSYYPQFYEPYQDYHAPIFAIPGNHDGDVATGAPDPSLATFVDNFCAVQPHRTAEAQEVARDAMIQPNVYWTLQAPFVTVVGLYTNCPEGGYVDGEQATWLERELAAAPKNVALIVALHHPIYSLSGAHIGSQQMDALLTDAIQVSGRVPDAIFTAHVHNYQRYTDTIQSHQVPVIVAGAGGYWHQHPLIKDPKTGGPIAAPFRVDQTTTLETYCDDRHGYLRVTVSTQSIAGEYVAVAGAHDPPGTNPNVVDRWTLDLASHKLRPAKAVGSNGSKRTTTGRRRPRARP